MSSWSVSVGLEIVESAFDVEGQCDAHVLRNKSQLAEDLEGAPWIYS